mgnify:CR=1 FL=1
MPAGPSPYLTLAPLQGITEVLFRNLFARHFPGFDAAMAPFVKPQEQARFPDHGGKPKAAREPR